VAHPVDDYGGSGADDVWFVGDSGTILHWDGTSIVHVRTPTGRALFGIWAATSRDAWAVGDKGTIVHWDGDRWTTVASPEKRALRRIDGDASGDVIAVGDHDIIEWDGARWSRVRAPACNAEYATFAVFTGVALADGGAIATCLSSDVIRRYAGGWGGSSGGGFASAYHDVASRREDIVIVGWYGTVVRSAAEEWARPVTPTAQPLRAAWISPSASVWAVGDGGAILYTP